jgi:hypothetical protein
MPAPVINKPAKQITNKGVLATPLLPTLESGEGHKWGQTGGLPPGLLLKTTTGEITGTPTGPKEKAKVKIQTENVAEEKSEVVEFEWEITEIPVITKPGPQSSHVNEVATPVTVAVSNAPTEVKATGLPKGLSIKESGAKIGEITGTPDTTKAEVKVKLAAKNAEGSAAIEPEFGWTITVDVPVVTKPANQNTGVGASVSLPIIATGSPTLYAATGLPAGLSINTATGVISGVPQTPTLTEAAVKVKAENAGGPSAEVSFGWKIVQGQAEANALLSKTPGAGWVAPDLWPALKG